MSAATPPAERFLPVVAAIPPMTKTGPGRRPGRAASNCRGLGW